MSKNAMIGATTRSFNEPVTSRLFLPIYNDGDGWFHKGMWYPRLLPPDIYSAEYTGYGAVGVNIWDFGFRVQYRSEITTRCFHFRMKNATKEEAKALHYRLKGVKGLKIDLFIMSKLDNWIRCIILPNGERIFQVWNKV